jgi:hypothetical protein
MMDPKPNETWTHYNGNVYTVMFLTNTSGKPNSNYPVTVVYKGNNGNVWSRPIRDWNRSFNKISMKDK